jgi:hypothetical protein
MLRTETRFTEPSRHPVYPGGPGRGCGDALAGRRDNRCGSTTARGCRSVPRPPTHRDHTLTQAIARERAVWADTSIAPAQRRLGAMTSESLSDVTPVSTITSAVIRQTVGCDPRSASRSPKSLSGLTIVLFALPSQAFLPQSSRPEFLCSVKVDELGRQAITGSRGRRVSTAYATSPTNHSTARKCAAIPAPVHRVVAAR